jgi:integrase
MRAAIAAGAPETARRIRARIEAIINAGIAKGQRDATRLNPADIKLVAAVFPSKRRQGDREHYRRIELDVAPSAFRAVQGARAGAEGHKAAALDAWLFMIACASRPSEALHAQWSEINPDKRL